MVRFNLSLQPEILLVFDYRAFTPIQPHSERSTSESRFPARFGYCLAFTSRSMVGSNSPASRLGGNRSSYN
jgi:hypothetical protein